MGELWSEIKRLEPGPASAWLLLSQFTCWAGGCASQGQYVGSHRSPSTLRLAAQPGAATELLPSAWAPSSAATLEPVVASLINMNKSVRRFHSSSSVPLRWPREFEQLTQGCTAVTPPRPGPSSFLMEDPGLHPGPPGSRTHHASSPRPQFPS